MISLLSRWLRARRTVNLAHWKVTVYTRSQCHCCHKALDLLAEYQRRHGFVIEEVDIDSDRDLVKLYDTSVPVVAINGKVRFKGVVNTVLLKRLIEVEIRRRWSSVSSP